MTRTRYFRCRQCDVRTWSEKAKQSECRNCKEKGERITKRKQLEWRQFWCRPCSRRWCDRAVQSKCRRCRKQAELIPKEEAVGACKFFCSACKNSYTVIFFFFFFFFLFIITFCTWQGSTNSCKLIYKCNQSNEYIKKIKVI